MKRVAVLGAGLILFLALGGSVALFVSTRRAHELALVRRQMEYEFVNARQAAALDRAAEETVVELEASSTSDAPAPLETRDYPSSETSIVLSELNYHPSGGHREDEWIELVNRSRAAIDLGGWKLEGGVQLTFPAGTRLEPGQFLVVGADKARLEASLGLTGVVGGWTGSLDDGGEKIQLTAADGKLADALKYDDHAPFPVLPDGHGRTLERRSLHERTDSPANWGSSAAGSSRASWVRAQASGVATAQRLYLYLQGTGVAYVDDIVLREASGKQEVHDDLEDGGARWSAVGNHAVAVGRGTVHSGRSALKISATGAGSGRRAAVFRDFPEVEPGKVYELELWAHVPQPGPPLVARFSSGPSNVAGFTLSVGGKVAASSSSTPGRLNSISSDKVPPLLFPVTHSPARPTPNDKVLFAARFQSPEAARQVLLQLSEDGVRRTEALHDDGDPAQGDEMKGDGVWSARLGPFHEGAVVLYHVVAEDSSGVTASYPLAENPTQQVGFLSESLSGPRKFPEYQFFLSADAVQDLNQNPFTDALRPGVFVHDGRVYPGASFRYRGQTSRGIPKHHWKVKFARDDPFVPSPGHRPVSSVNLNSAFADGSYIREILSYGLWRDLGQASSESWHVRVKLNGELLGLYVYVENPGGDYMERNGLEKGWLWKAYDDGSRGAGGFELKAGDPATGRAALEEFLGNVNSLQGQDLEAYLRERLNVDSFIDFLVACQLVHSADHVQKNYLVHGSPTGKFTFYPWDMDLTHGHNFECRGGGIWGGELRWDLWDPENRDEKLLFGTQAHRKCDGWANAVIDAFLRRTEAFRPAYYKRLAECLAHYYDPEVLLPRVERWRSFLKAEATEDMAHWPSFGSGGFEKSYSDLVRWTRKRHQHLVAKLKALGYEVPPPLNADFACDARHGDAPLRVTFENRSAGKFDACEWDFGDGEKSAEANPVHAYSKPGKHTVTLKVTGPGGVHAQARRDWIHVKK